MIIAITAMISTPAAPMMISGFPKARRGSVGDADIFSGENCGWESMSNAPS
jgi:hypothetical protein